MKEGRGNYTFYLFGAALDAFFALYVSSVILAVFTAHQGVAASDARQVASRFTPLLPVGVLGGSFVFVGIGLAAVWLGM